MAATWDGTVHRIYFDGKKIYEGTLPGLNSQMDHTTDKQVFRLGANATTAATLRGMIDEVELYGGVLSDQKIKALARRPRS